MTITKSITTEPAKYPKMIVFDLDRTLWTRWIGTTGGPPFVYDEKSNTIYRKKNKVLGLYETTSAILTLINTFPDTKIGIASRSGATAWAKEALSQLRVPELDITVIELVDYIEVYSGSKLRHFKALSKKSGISCDEMLFFDDESRNREVTSLGIHFVLVDPKVGVTLQQFEEALHDYAENQTLDK